MSDQGRGPQPARVRGHGCTLRPSLGVRGTFAAYSSLSHKRARVMGACKKGLSYKAPQVPMDSHVSPSACLEPASYSSISGTGDGELGS